MTVTIQQFKISDTQKKSVADPKVQLANLISGKLGVVVKLTSPVECVVVTPNVQLSTTILCCVAADCNKPTVEARVVPALTTKSVKIILFEMPKIKPILFVKFPNKEPPSIIRFKHVSIEMPLLLLGIGAFLLGIAIGVPITYLFSCIFARAGDSILWGTISYIILSLALIRRYTKISYHSIHLTLSEIVFVVFSVCFSYWLMTKTFHGSFDGQLFVGSNNVFDFGHALGIIRSFSWGNHILFTSPFQAGLPFFYHLFVYPQTQELPHEVLQHLRY